MKIQATLCALAALASAASATLVIGTTTVALGGGTVAVLLGAKLLALKGLLIGRALGKRSTENLAEIFLEASRKDQYDCAKLLICELNAKPAQELMVRNLFKKAKRQILQFTNLKCCKMSLKAFKLKNQGLKCFLK